MHLRQLLLASLLSVGACGPTITLTDDIDLTWDFGPTLSRFEDSLHGPYVRGTKMTLFVDSDDNHQNWTGWTIAAVDPTVLHIEATASDSLGLAAQATAVSTGDTDIVVLDAHGGVVGRGHAHVGLPDHVQLDAHGYLIVGRGDEAPVEEARILEGGEATYLVTYFEGGTELHGNGVLTTGTPNGIVAEPRTTFLFENREWLSITSTQLGVTTLPLLVDGTQIGGAQIVTVPQTDIDGMALLSQGEKDAHDGDWLVALAQSYDANGRRVFGVDYAWDVNGHQLDADGDLYRYEYKKGDYQMVTAHVAGHQDSMEIQSDAGFVDSTNNIGCSAAGGGGAGFGVLAAFGIVLRRRRR